MDRKTVEQLHGLLSLLIGEIMEDHVDEALRRPVAAGAADRLELAGEDIACLAAAMRVAARRTESASPD